MGKATLTFADGDNHTIKVTIEFDPPVGENDEEHRGAAQTAMRLLELFQEESAEDE